MMLTAIITDLMPIFRDGIMPGISIRLSFGSFLKRWQNAGVRLRGIIMTLQGRCAIIGAILLGPAAGAILGGVFGICSLISNTMAPTLLSFAFSPFMSTTGIPGAVKAVWISVGCRILIGVTAGWLWILLSKLKVNNIIALPVVGFAGAMVNTITVMGSIYILFAKQYAEAKDVAVSAVWGLVMGTVTASGIPEAIAAAILVLAIGKVLIGVFRKMNIGNV